MATEKPTPPAWFVILGIMVMASPFLLCGGCFLTAVMNAPTVEEKAAELAHAESMRKQEQVREEQKAQEELAKKRDKQEQFDAAASHFAGLMTKVDYVTSSNLDEHNRIRIKVANAWHYEPKPIRLQEAQNLYKIWMTCGTFEKRGMQIVDLNGNEVGGQSKLSGVWVDD